MEEGRIVVSYCLNPEKNVASVLIAGTGNISVAGAVSAGTNDDVTWLVCKMIAECMNAHLWKDEELRWFLKSVGILTLFITGALFLTDYYDLETSFRKALFQVATAHTSCGFTSDDYNLWPPCTWMLLIFAMISGGCTGSTSGGVKNMRLLIIARNIRNQFKQMLHPRAVLPVRVNGICVPVRTSATVFTFFGTYLICIFIGWILLMCCGVGLTESMSTVISAIGNVGPGLGAFGPAFSWAALPDAAKWILSALMLIGRLEIFGILLLFYRGYWKDE